MSNMIKRILFAIVGIPIVFAIIYLGDLYIWGLTLFLIEIAWWEYSSMLKVRGFYTKAASLGYIWIILLFARFFMNTNSWFNTEALILSFVIAGMLWELSQKNMSFSISRVSVQLMGFIYLGLAGYSIFLVSTLITPAWKIMVPFLLSVWLCDTFAYFIGKSFGKHLLWPAVSPKKTIEGSIAGVVGAIAGFSVILIWQYSQTMLIHIPIAGIGIGIVGQTGDLFESMIKRWADVKDSSKILPGHGGIFDRIDSMLIAAPFIVFYFRYII